MTIATKNGSIIVKDGKLAENCACCGGTCQAQCPCGFGCDTPLPNQIEIDISGLTFANIGFDVPFRRSLAHFNGTYVLCKSDGTPSTDFTPQQCNAASPSVTPCRNPFSDNRLFSGLCTRGAVSKCAIAAASFACTAGTGLGGVFLASSYGFVFTITKEFQRDSLTLFGLFAQPDIRTGRSLASPTFEGWTIVGRDDASKEGWVYDTAYNQLVRGAFLPPPRLGNEPGLDFAQIAIRGIGSCTAPARGRGGLPYGPTVPDTHALLSGNGFDANAYTDISENVSVRVTLVDYSMPFGRCLAINEPPFEYVEPPAVTSYSLTNAECESITARHPTLRRSVNANPENDVRAQATILYFALPEYRANYGSNYPATHRAYSVDAVFPAAIRPSYECDPRFQFGTYPGFSVGHQPGGFARVSGIAPVGQLPPSYYRTTWVDASVPRYYETQSTDGLEAAPHNTIIYFRHFIEFLPG